MSELLCSTFELVVLSFDVVLDVAFPSTVLESVIFSTAPFTTSIIPAVMSVTISLTFECDPCGAQYDSS